MNQVHLETNFFVQKKNLPFQTVLRVFDCFLSEGPKIFLRFGLAILKFKERKLLQCDTIRDFSNELMSPIKDADEVIKIAFSINISKSKILKLNQKNHEKKSYINENTLTYYLPKIEKTSKIILREHWEFLWGWLPHRYRIMDPVFVYDASENGYSLVSYVTQSKSISPQILIFQTTKKEIFGAFIGEPWENQKKTKGYFGTRETFVWTLQPQPAKYGWSEGNNDYFMLSDFNNSSIQIGGGTGPAIWIDTDIDKGATNESSTFGNKLLCSEKEFSLLKFEVYTIA